MSPRVGDVIPASQVPASTSELLKLQRKLTAHVVRPNSGGK